MQQLQLNQQTLLNSDKAAITQMIAAYTDLIEQGEIDPVEAYVLSHKLLEFASQLNTKLKAEIKGTQGDFYGLRISEAKTGSHYDYGACNSPRLNYLVAESNRLKTLLDKEQAYLKSLPRPIQTVDDETGEICEIRPPINTYQISPKIEWL